MQLCPGNRVIWLNPSDDREYKAQILQLRKLKAQILLVSLDKCWVDVDQLSLVPLLTNTFEVGDRVCYGDWHGWVDLKNSDGSVRVHWDNGSVSCPTLRSLSKSSISTSAIEHDDIEHDLRVSSGEATPTQPNCSISTPAIEQLDSDRCLDIEQNDIEHSPFPIPDSRLPLNCSISLGTYIRRRGDKEYEYWRLSWREGHRMFHRHVPIGKLNQVREAIVAGRSRAEILLLV